MKPYHPAIAIMAFSASLQFAPAAQADASYLYMIPSIMGMGTSIYQQERVMTMQQEMQRGQLESLRAQQNHPQPASSSEIAELRKLLEEQRNQIAALQRQLERNRTAQGPH